MRRIGPYIIRGLLGRGGMGAVYRVLDPDSGRILALKLLSPRPELLDLAGYDTLRREFLREAGLMTGLRHPNLATAFNPGEYNGRPYYLMDFHCDNLGLTIGETYRVEAPSRPLPLEQACAYTLQILDGLHALHSAGIVHRDIKPFNMLITPDDRIRIIDFGLSRVRHELPARLGPAAIGSPYYAAPEQEADPDSADARADLFSVGVMLCRMLCGHLPQYEDGDGPACLRPSGLNPDLDPAWDAFIAEACAPNPDHRFPSAHVMAATLFDLLNDWRDRISTLCTDFTLTPRPPSTQDTRSIPLKASPANAQNRFNLDPLWRPRTYSTSTPTTSTLTVTDTHLLWQRAATPLPYSAIPAHLAHLNATAFANRTTWRLPTISELSSLLRPPAHQGDHCLTPAFPPTPRRLWSADRKSFAAAWFADTTYGFIGHADFDCALGVRAVCDLRDL